MKIKKGNIWDAEPIAGYVVVPTSIGWKHNGESVMGVGLAREASERFPELPKLYGTWCKINRKKIYVNDSLRVICVPIKPLNAEEPHLSWQGVADPELIMLSYIKLLKLAESWKNPNCSDEGVKYIKCCVLGVESGKIRKKDGINYAEQFSWPDNVSFFERERG
jgi:hypothetical protein